MWSSYVLRNSLVSDLYIYISDGFPSISKRRENGTDKNV